MIAESTIGPVQPHIEVEWFRGDNAYYVQYLHTGKIPDLPSSVEPLKLTDALRLTHAAATGTVAVTLLLLRADRSSSSSSQK